MNLRFTQCYIRFALFLLCQWFAVAVYAEEDPAQEHVFVPHLSGDPQTAGHLHFNYEPFAGSFITEQTIGSSVLSLGLGDRLEVGTNPALFLTEARGFLARSAMIKYNFLKAARYAFALGYGLLHVRTLHEIKTANNTLPSHFTMTQQGITLMLSYACSDNIGVGASIVTRTFDSHPREVNGQSTNSGRHQFESFTDVSWRASDTLTWSMGISRTVEEDFFADQRRYHMGAGATATWTRPGEFLSAPALGLHFIEGKSWPLFLLSTKFY